MALAVDVKGAGIGADGGGEDGQEDRGAHGGCLVVSRGDDQVIEIVVLLPTRLCLTGTFIVGRPNGSPLIAGAIERIERVILFLFLLLLLVHLVQVTSHGCWPDPFLLSVDNIGPHSVGPCLQLPYFQMTAYG